MWGMNVMEYKTLSLRESAKFDFENGLRDKLTGWGVICKLRHEKKISRKQRRLAAKGN